MPSLVPDRGCALRSVALLLPRGNGATRGPAACTRPTTPTPGRTTCAPSHDPNVFVCRRQEELVVTFAGIPQVHLHPEGDNRSSTPLELGWSPALFDAIRQINE